MTPDKVEAALGALRLVVSEYKQKCCRSKGADCEVCNGASEALSVLTEALAERDALRDALATAERDRDSARASIELAGLARRKPHDR